MDPEVHADPSAGASKVVVVDEDAHVRGLVRAALDEEPDFALVAEATHAAAALVAVRDRQPDVVLLDIAMLVADGLDTLPLIRQECPAAIVVVMSGARVSSE